MHPMHEAAAFLRLIAERPADDGPRLLYADWLAEHGDPDRADFIRMQCALAQLPRSDQRRPDLEAAELRLRATHADEWLGLEPGAVDRCTFRRGFPDEVSLSAESFLEHGSRLFATGPVRTVHLFEIGPRVGELAAAEALAGLTGLGLCGNGLGDDGVAVLVRSPYFGQLRELDLSFNLVTDAGVRDLATADTLPSLRVLGLSHNELIGVLGAEALARSPHLQRLEALDLVSNDLDDTAVRWLVGRPGLPELVELKLADNRVGDRGVEILVGSALLPRMLARSPALDLSRNDVTATGLQTLLACPRLVPLISLNLSGNAIGDVGLIALTVADWLPNLRELSLNASGITDEGIFALVDTPLFARLRVFHVADNALSVEGMKALTRARERLDLNVEFNFAGNVPLRPPVIDYKQPIHIDYDESMEDQ
jgi:uncharacterized protein (TIGR02996 family)